MINLDDLERRVLEGYSIPPYGEGKELVKFLRLVEEEVRWPYEDEGYDDTDRSIALDSIRANFKRLMGKS